MDEHGNERGQAYALKKGKGLKDSPRSLKGESKMRLKTKVRRRRGGTPSEHGLEGVQRSMRSPEYGGKDQIFCSARKQSLEMNKE